MDFKQAPRAWYDKLSAFLIKSGFTKGVVDPTLFTRKAGKHLLLAKPTEMHLTAIKRIFRYLKGTIHMGLWYPKDSDFELKAFADADYAGCHDTRRSTSGSAQFLGHRLVSWSQERPVLDSYCCNIGHDQPHYNFNTGFAVSFMSKKVILWNTEKRDVVPPKGFFVIGNAHGPGLSNYAH
ncbi:retrovirus-related pol polyprotein from transposon TNT 1-94 [Tanacetum coccineum]